jgi:medium-chain acyl-[acyl-carrier-protein] hydrolase
MQSRGIFPFRRPSPGARIRLVCFPYAGASASVFRRWPELLGPQIEVCAIELRGRATRLGEPPTDRVDVVVDELAQAVQSLHGLPIALFGHSLGARLAFAVARALGPGSVEHLFVSAAPAPDIVRARRPVATDAELKRELVSLGGTPAEILENDELMGLVLPALRADFSLADRLIASPEPYLTCGVTAFAGRRDADVPGGDVEAWSRVTAGSFRAVVLDEGHFFLDPCAATVTREVAQDLAHVMQVPGARQEADGSSS